MFLLSSRVLHPSSSSGHTPPTFHHFSDPSFSALVPLRYLSTIPTFEYLRATNVMEHVLLACVRWQKTHRVMSHLVRFGGGPGSAASLGVPTRLKDWIRGYPAMLPEPATRSRKHDRLQPCHGARTVRVVSVMRNVRVYTPDLVKTAACWAPRPPSGVTHAPNVFA